jgi:hypothetical protein
MTTAKESPCVEWTKCKNAAGYGRAWHNGTLHLAHRLAYCKYHNVSLESIKGWVIRHTCDNPSCVNPHHLLIGTAADNTRDKVSKGRHSRGETSFHAKLTEGQVAEIRATYVARDRESGSTALARKFGVSQSTISRIVNNNRWTYLRTNDQTEINQ